MFNFPVELHRTNELLERIANALDRAIPPVILPLEGDEGSPKPSRVVQYGQERKMWETESIKQEIMNLGASPEETEAMTSLALSQYLEAESRRQEYENNDEVGENQGLLT